MVRNTTADIEVLKNEVHHLNKHMEEQRNDISEIKNALLGKDGIVLKIQRELIGVKKSNGLLWKITLTLGLALLVGAFVSV